MAADGRLILFILIAFTFIIVGRKLQRMLDLWRSWRAAIAALPGQRAAAWGGVRTMFKVGAVAAVVFWAASHLNYFM